LATTKLLMATNIAAALPFSFKMALVCKPLVRHEVA
jgi:hypothetical protein